MRVTSTIPTLDAPAVDGASRLAAVRATGLLDAAAEPAFDRLTRLAVRLLRVPAAFFSLVDETRDFYVSACGFGEPLASERELTGPSFCHYAIQSSTPLVIPDTAADPLYRDVPTVRTLGVAAYVGVPIVVDGEVIGSFCAIDTVPRAWTAADVEVLIALAASAEREIELRAALHRGSELARELQRQADALRGQQAELAQSEERFRGAFESSGIGFAIVGLDGGWIQVNPEICRIVGYSRDELRARTFQDITHPDDLDADLAQVRLLMAGDIRNYTMEKRYLSASGSVVWVLLTVSMVHGADGEPLHFVAQIQDITERRLTEVRLRRAAQMDAVATLAGGIAHDFNNLLTVILGSAELILADATTDPALQQDAAAISTAAERAAELTQQLLSFARRQVVQTSVARMDSILREAEPLLQRTVFSSHQLVFRGTSGNVRVRADAGELQLALLNLVANARDAMPSGGVIAISHDVTDVDGTNPDLPLAAGQYVQLTVIDAGTGLTAEAEAHLFEPFFSTKPVGQGTGLGLATVFGILRAVGGCVTYESTPGRGARFSLWLPVDDAVDAEPPFDGVADGRNARVALVVDDEVTVRNITVRALSQNGFTVLIASHGAEAIELLETHPEVNVLITDFVMPGMTGGEVLKIAADRFPNVRRVLISGYTPDEDTRLTLTTTDTVFLAKPFSIAALLSAVSDALARVA